MHLLLLLGCAGSDSPSPADSAAIRAPSIVTAKVSCNEESAVWTFQATTDAWTGNGQIVLSTDGDYVEKHPMYSTSAEADGSADKLSLQLNVVADWRDVSLGASTVFNCEEPALTGILRVFTQSGGEQAACRAFGADPERWDGWDAGVTCAELLGEE